MDSMLDQALESSGQDKGNDSDTDDVQLSQDGYKVQFVKGDMDDGTGDGEEQAAAIASVSSGTIILDQSALQFQIRADQLQNQGQLQCRVVQVGDGSDGQAQVAVLSSPFSNGGSPDELDPNTRFTYVTSSGETTEASIAQMTAAGADFSQEGQFYVMMSPENVLSGQRALAPRTHSLQPRIEGGRGGRDERRRATHNEDMRPARRATHNEVERRRRDKINNWIVQLSKLVPDCSQDHTKQGQVSKGGILAKACEYITGLRTANARMAESLKDVEKLNNDVDLLRAQCEELQRENSILRNHMSQHGVMPPDLQNNS